MVLSSNTTVPGVWFVAVCVAGGFFLLHRLCSNILAAWSVHQKTVLYEGATRDSDKQQPHNFSHGGTTVIDSFCSLPLHEGSNRLVSITHSILAIAISILTLSLDAQPFGAPLTSIHALGLTFSLGFFLYDMMYELTTLKSTSLILHHVMACIGLGCGLLTQSSGTELIASILATEISTPFYHLRAFFRQRRTVTEQARYYTVSMAFGLIFLLSRCLTLGPYITYNTVRSSTTPLFVKISGTTVYLLSLMWGYRILHHVLSCFSRTSNAYPQKCNAL